MVNPCTCVVNPCTFMVNPCTHDAIHQAKMDIAIYSPTRDMHGGYDCVAHRLVYNYPYKYMQKSFHDRLESTSFTVRIVE